MLDGWALARSIQKHVRRLKSAGYSHPPIVTDECAYFDVTTHGRKYRVTVQERTVDDELREAREWCEQNKEVTA